MIKFKFITTFVANAVAKYKAQRVRDVVSQYCATVDAQVTIALPVAIEFYRGVATAIVDKTFENPAPALQLVAADGAALRKDQDDGPLRTEPARWISRPATPFVNR